MVRLKGTRFEDFIIAAKKQPKTRSNNTSLTTTLKNPCGMRPFVDAMTPAASPTNATIPHAGGKPPPLFRVLHNTPNS